MTDATFREDLINRLFRIPAKLSAAVLVVMLIVGYLVGGVVGGVLLGAAVLVLAGILVLLWPDISGVERMLRLAVLVFVVALAIVRLAPGA